MSDIYHQNKYTRWYYSIIDRSKIRTNEGYTESHHIIPKCIGGIETVDLTAREHFICHLLLPKMVKTKRHYYQMIAALHWFEPLLNNRQYEIYKIEHAFMVSYFQKGKPKPPNTIIGWPKGKSRGPMNEERKASQRGSRKPYGKQKNPSKQPKWNKGLTKETDTRVLNNAIALRGRIPWNKNETS